MADLGGFLGFHGTPLWAGPSTKKYHTDTRDRLKWNPPSLTTQLRKLLWLTSAYFSRKFVQKQVDWTGSFSQKRSKWAWFYAKVGVASKILRALRAQQYYGTPLQEILNPPLRGLSYAHGICTGGYHCEKHSTVGTYMHSTNYCDNFGEN